MLSISVPALILGRSAIGVTLGVAFLASLPVLYRTYRTFPWLTIKKHFLFKILIFTVLCLGISSFFSLDLSKSLSSLARTIVMIGLIFLCCWSQKDHLHRLAPYLGCAALGSFIFLWLQDNPNNSKMALNGLLLILPLLFYFLRDSKLKFLLFSFLAIFFTYLVLILHAKATLAGILLLIAIYSLFLLSRKMPIRWFIIGSLIVIPLIAVAASYWLYQAQNYNTRLTADEGYLPVFLIDIHRQLIWWGALKIAELSPWVGFGLNASNFHPIASAPLGETFPLYHQYYNSMGGLTLIPSHPHNWIMEFLLDAGLLGTIPMLVLISTIFITLIRKVLQTQNQALLALLAIQAAYWGTGLLNFSFWSTWWQASYFLCSSLALCLYLREKEVAENA